LDKTNESRGSDKGDKAGLKAHDVSILKELPLLSGKEALDRILEHPDPGGLIKGLPDEDFFWLMKGVGDDCTQLLRLASLRQWQYILDMELWEKDRLDLAQTFLWLQRLERSDPGRLVRYLFTEGQSLAYLYLFRSIRVEVRDEDEAYDLEKGFVTLDGLFYVNVNREEERDTLERILKTMAHEDLLRYHALLMGLTGVLPAELEEEMYRLRNVRMAEHGFLPREEALLCYAPLDLKAIEQEDPRDRVSDVPDKEALELAPYTPFYFSQGFTLLTDSVSRITDPDLLERIRLEFAGLCNQILSADGSPIHDMEILKKTGRKAAGYLNLCLEKVSKGDTKAAQELMEKNRLISLFRAGFSLALKLKWEAERWFKEGWFDPETVEYSFWGEQRGNTLAGLMSRKPLYYCGPEGEEEYRDFERISELNDVGEILHGLMALDGLLLRLTDARTVNREEVQDRALTLHNLLFTLWARQMLGLESSLEPVSIEDATRFFRLLRKGDKSPPFQMLGFEQIFVKDFMTPGPDPGSREGAALKQALTSIWQEFCEEYDFVELHDLDPKFSRYILINPS